MSNKIFSMTTQVLPQPLTERGSQTRIASTKDSVVFCNGCIVYLSPLDLNYASDKTSCFQGHTVKVNVAAPSPNGEWIASGDDQGCVRIWAARPPHAQKYDYRLIPGAIKDISWSPDSKRIAVCGDGGRSSVSAVCIAYDTGSKQGDIIGHTKAVTCIAYRPIPPFRIITGGEDFNVCFHEGPPLKFMRSQPNAHSNFVNAVAFSPSGDLACSCGSDGVLNFYAGDTGDILTTRAGPGGSLWGLCTFGSRVITVGKILQVWENFAETASFTPPAPLLGVAPGVAVTLSGTILTFDISEKVNLVTSRDGWQGIPTTLLNVYGALHCACTDGSFARLKNQVEVLTREGKRNSAAQTIFEFSGKIFFIAQDDTVCDFSANFPLPKNFSVSLATKFGEKLLLLSNKDNSIVIFDPATKSTCAFFKMPKSASALSSCGDTFAIAPAADAQTLNPKFTINIHQGDTVTTLETDHQHEISALRFSADGALLASGCCGGRVSLWRRSDTWKKMNCEHWTYHKSKITCLKFSKNGNLFSAGLDKQICEWRENEGLLRRRRDAHRDGVTAILADFPGNFCVSAGGDRIIKFWKEEDFSA